MLNLDRLTGDDIFISYSRKDGGLYASGLADALTEGKAGGKKFSCFVDKMDAEPNHELPEKLKKKIRGCTMFVLVTTEGAAKSDFVRQEIEEFRKTKRKIVPISVGGAFDRAVWYESVPGLGGEPEDPATLLTGEPSENVLRLIKTSFEYTRRNKKLARMAWGTFIVFAVLGVLSLFLLRVSVAKAAEAEEQTRRATAASAEADKQTRNATEATQLAQRRQQEAETARTEAEAAKEIADAAKAEAEAAQRAADAANAEARAAQERADREEERARIAAAEAKERQAEARSIGFANVAVRSLADDPTRSLALSIRAARTAATEEAADALKTSLERSRLTAVHWAEGDWRKGGWLYSSFSRDGRRFVAAGSGEGDVTGGVKVIDTASGRTVSQIRRIGVFSLTAEFDGAGRRVVTADSDGVARVWDAETGRALESLSPKDADEVAAMDAATGKKIIASLTGDSGRKLLDSLAELARAGGESEAKIAEMLEEAKKELPKVLKEMEEEGKKELAEPKDKDRGEDPLVFAAFVGDGDRVVTASHKGLVRIWDAKTGQRLQLLEGRLAVTRPVPVDAPPVLPGAAFSRDRRRVALIGADEKHSLALKVWDTETGRKLNDIGLENLSFAELIALDDETMPGYAALSGDGLTALTMRRSGKGPAVTLWDLKANKARKVIDKRVGLKGDYVYPVLGNRGDKMVTCNEDGVVQSWIIEENSDEPHNQWVGHSKKQRRLLAKNPHAQADEDTGIFWYAAFSPDDELVVSVAGDDTARVTNFDYGEEVFAFRSPAYKGADIIHNQSNVPPVVHAAFSPDSKTLLTSSLDGGARLYDLAERQIPSAFDTLLRLASEKLPSTLTRGELRLMLEGKNWGPPSVVNPPAASAGGMRPSAQSREEAALREEVARCCRASVWTDPLAVQLKAMLDEEFGVDASVFRCDAVLSLDYGFTDDDHERLLKRLQEKFSVTITEDTMNVEDILTPCGLLNRIRQARGAAAPPSGR